MIYVDGQTGSRLFSAMTTSWAVGGKKIPVPRPEYLIAMKVHAIKNDPSRTFKDLADIQFLLSLPDIDEQEVKGYFESAGLLGRFDELKALR